MLGDNATSQRIVSQSLKSAKRFSDVRGDTRHIDDVTGDSNAIEEEEEDDDDTAMREMLTAEYLEGTTLLYSGEAKIARREIQKNHYWVRDIFTYGTQVS